MPHWNLWTCWRTFKSLGLQSGLDLLCYRFIYLFISLAFFCCCILCQRQGIMYLNAPLKKTLQKRQFWSFLIGSSTLITSRYIQKLFKIVTVHHLTQKNNSPSQYYVMMNAAWEYLYHCETLLFYWTNYLLLHKTRHCAELTGNSKSHHSKTFKPEVSKENEFCSSPRWFFHTDLSSCLLICNTAICCYCCYRACNYIDGVQGRLGWS